MAFQLGETIVCSIEVRNTATGALANPAGDAPIKPVSITITDPAGDPAKNSGTTVVTKIEMANDGVGLYHYDFTPNPTYDVGPPIKEVAEFGLYLVRYVATDGARITIEDDDFVIEA